MYMYELDKPKNIIKIAQETALNDIVLLFLHLLVLWKCRVQHLFENRVAPNSGLGGVKNVASAIISHECCFQALDAVFPKDPF